MKKKWRPYSFLTPYSFILPSLILLFIFNIYPVVQTIALSFMKIERGIFIFNGIDNYIRLLNDKIFWKALFNSLIYLVIQVPIMTVLSFLLAVLLYRGVNHLKGIFRSIFFIPTVVEAVAYSLIFLLLFQDEGIVNYILSLVNIDPILWTKSAWPARILVMTVMTWRWTGYNMVMFLASCQSIPEDLFEAAKLDGANIWQISWNIIFPQVKPVVLFSVIMSTIGTLNLFSEPYLLTRGGPINSTMSLGLYVYDQAFGSFNTTYASTISIAIVIIVAVITRLQLFIGGKDEK